MSNLQQLKDLKVAYKNCFEGEDGKKVLADLERRCFIKERTFSPDTHLTAYNEGTRGVVLYINQMRDMDYGVQKGQEEGEKVNDSIS